MDTAVRRFRKDAAVHLGHRTGTAIRYTPALRRRAVAIAQERRDTGVAVTSVARDLGVRPQSLRLWLQSLIRGARASTGGPGQRLVEGGHRAVQVGVVDHERRLEPQDIAVVAADANQEAILEHARLDAAGR